MLKDWTPVFTGVTTFCELINIRELIEERVAGSPDKIYLYYNNQEVTYADFDKNINRLSNRILNGKITYEAFTERNHHPNPWALARKR